MISCRFVCGGVLVAFCVAWSISAQEPPVADPFGAEPAAAAPAAAPPAAKKQTEPEVVETDSVVLAIRESNPKSPFELTRAIENLMNLGRPDEAKKYLKALTDQNPDKPTLVWLQQKFGSVLFSRLSTDKGMQPEGQPFAESVLDAAYEYAHSPARLAALIKQLSDSSPAARTAAQVDLRVAGEDAAVALILALADPNRTSERGVLRRGLANLGRAAEGPAFAALESMNEDLRLQILAVLTNMRSPQVTAFLLRPALTGEPNSVARTFAVEALRRLQGGLPTMGAAQRYLERESRAYFEGQLPRSPDHENLITQWRWDHRLQRPIVERVPPKTASLRTAARLAGELTQLVPNNQEYRKIYATALLESSKLAAGWEKKLELGTATPLAIFSQFKPQDLEAVLAFALDGGHLAAAVAALEIAGEMKNLEFVVNSAGTPRVVVHSLQHSDRRVRFASLQAIRSIDPKEPFAGASLVPEAIGSFARASATRRVLVAHPVNEQSQTLVGMLRELGLEADKALNGKQAFDLALEHVDYEFLLISDAIEQPSMRDLLHRIRRDPRLAKIPVGVLARQETFDQVKEQTADDPLVVMFPFPADLPGASYLVGRLAERAGDYPMSPEEGLRQAATALAFFAELASQPEIYGFYDLIRQESAADQALATPALAPRAALILGYLATPTAQQSLVTLASQNQRELRSRLAAARAFEIAVKRRGVLLTSRSILAQYDRYNASATLDRDTQQVLGSILDSIEAPSKTSPVVASVESN